MTSRSFSSAKWHNPPTSCVDIYNGAVPPEQAIKPKETRGRTVYAGKADIVEWAESNFFIASGGLIQLAPHQKCILRLAFTRGAGGRFPYVTIIYSTIKKSGKSATAAMTARWFAETQTRYGEIYAIGNDAKQARERSFAEVRRSLELSPGFIAGRRLLPGRWQVMQESFHCLTTGSIVAALSLDARGEAGSAPALTIWTELWGFESEEAKRFWEELTPVPTLPDSIRLVETYAGYEGESGLLFDLYNRGMEGRQLTAHDLAMAGATDAPGETYEELLYAFAETEGDPAALVPVWVDESSRMLMYWDEGDPARRMPWQLGPLGQEYYAAQEASLPPRAYQRLHQNLWVSAESAFIPIELWDRCHDPELGPIDVTTPIVLGVDAAVTQDCFGIVAVSRHPKKPDDPAIRAAKVWTPPKGGVIDFDEPEAFMRWLLVGGCILGHPPPAEERGGMSTPILDSLRAECAACRDGERIGPHNVVHICYDPFQLENMMQRFNREGLTWVKKFPQGNDRLVSDKQLYTVITTGRLTWDFARADDAQAMRDHIKNANVKLQKDSDSKMRLIKKTPSLKIDLAVAAAMAIDRCLRIIMS